MQKINNQMGLSFTPKLMQEGFIESRAKLNDGRAQFR